MHGRIPSKQQDNGLPDSAASGAELDLRRVLGFMLHRWKLIVATPLAVMLFAFVAMMALTPRFTATVQILLEPKKQSVFGHDSILPELTLDPGNVDSQVSVVKSINLLRRVVEKHHLTSDPEFGRKDTPGLLAVIRGMVFTPGIKPSLRLGEADDVPLPTLETINRLQDALRVSRVALTYVISISVTSDDPGKTMRLANAIADAYVVDRLDARYDAAKRASMWLTERIETLRAHVRRSEEAVARFRHEHNLTTSIDGEVAVTEQQLTELNAKLVAARSETAEKRAKYEQAHRIKGSSGNLQAISDVVRSTVISDLRKLEAEVARKMADLASRYSDAHPTVVNARAERRDVERSIAAEVSRIIANVKNDYDVALAREASLQQSINALTGSDGGDGSIGVRLRELERVNVANKTLFENFLSRAKITHEQTAFEEREARIISPATKPQFASFPRKSLTLALAAVFGIALGICSAVALQVLSSGFLYPREVETILGRPVLTSISFLSDSARKVDGKVLNLPNYLLKKPLSRYSEQIRAVRVGVQMADVDNPAKVILVTSSAPKEGKSTLAIGLALLAARAGQRALLIDCDLRHPSISGYFNAQRGSGLVDFLTGATTLDEALFAAGPITVLPAGSISQNPADLLGSARMKQMVAHLREAYDYVVIDSPPVAPVVDTKIIQHLADKIVYIVRWQTTPREMVSQCIDQLAPGRRLAGIAFNLVNESKTPRIGPHGYYAGSRYGQYYQN
jgi:polysaccharide biosynthesis transport protein